MKYILIILLFTTSLFADEIQVPASCYPKVLQEQFKEYGLQLDLSGNDKTPESWGFIENRGTYFNILSYGAIAEEDFKIITKVLFGDNYGLKK